MTNSVPSKATHSPSSSQIERLGLATTWYLVGAARYSILEPAGADVAKVSRTHPTDSGTSATLTASALLRCSWVPRSTGSFSEGTYDGGDKYGCRPVVGGGDKPKLSAAGDDEKPSPPPSMYGPVGLRMDSGYYGYPQQSTKFVDVDWSVGGLDPWSVDCVLDWMND
jgi:hypothetical protein